MHGDRQRDMEEQLPVVVGVRSVLGDVDLLGKNSTSLAPNSLVHIAGGKSRARDPFSDLVSSRPSCQVASSMPRRESLFSFEMSSAVKGWKKFSNV